MITYNKLGHYGRLGNQMFEIAGTIGLATKHGYDFGFPKWINHDHAKKGYEGDINVQDYFVNPLPEVEPNDAPEVRVPWGYHDISIPDNVSLWGHMQSEKYFTHCKDQVRHYFEMKQMFVKLYPNSVAVHLRAGDYDGNYHPIMTKEYYREAMSLFVGYDYYLFSDDIELFRAMIGEADNIHYLHSSYMTDFYVMRNCTHHIISNSTFSWWAAWLGQKEGTRVIAPSNWFGSVAKISSKDIYPDNWIVI